MSRLSRKPPPKIDEPIEQFKFDIEEYLNNSPITNQFRLDNPNLQPATSNESDTVDSPYTLDPSRTTPPSPAVSNTSKGDNLMDHKFHHPSSSVESNTSDFQVKSAASTPGSYHTAGTPGSSGAFKSPGPFKPPTGYKSPGFKSPGTAFTTTPLEREPTNGSDTQSSMNTLQRKQSKLQRLKRLSLNRLDMAKTTFIPNHRKYNSLSASQNRLSISSPVSNSYSHNSLSMTSSLRDPNQRDPNQRDSSRDSPRDPNTTGLGLGLSGSSTPVSGGSGPGSLRGSRSNQSLASVSTNTTINTLNNTITNCNDDKISTPYWKYHVLKFGKDLYLSTNPSLKHMYCRNGPGYYVEINKEKDDGYTMIFKDAETQSGKPPIMIICKKAKAEGGYFTASLTRSSTLKKNMIKYCNSSEKNVFNGLSIPQTIPEKFIPYDKVSNVKFLEQSEVGFKNYEFRDFNSVKWNIGSIPRVRSSKLNKFKQKLNDLEPEQLKFIGKKNVYFHQNYIESNQSLPFKSTNPEGVYLQNSENNNFPPVLAMFRPYKRKFTSKVKNFNKIMTKKDEESSQFKPEKFNHQIIENDVGDHKNYFIAGDGLYYYKNPADDLPDENKAGWLTVYEDKLFQERGMFDLVLGLTLAVGYENSLT